MSLGHLSEVPRSHSDTPHCIGLLLTSDQPVEQTSTLQQITHKRQTSMPLEFQQANSRRPKH